MNYRDRWLLPTGIADILPEEAMLIEEIRQKLLKLYGSWGYQLVIPPLIEYSDSLLPNGTGEALNLQTFKLIDQVTGRLLGVRADMTPQIARIDAHRLKREEPSRLCYLGSVLHTRSNNFAGSRSPLQTGAELYGYAGIAADIEVLSLMLETLQTVGVNEFHIDIGHVAIYQSLLKQAQLDNSQQARLSDIIKRKDIPELHQQLSEWQVPTQQQDRFDTLLHLHGDASILSRAYTELKDAPAEVYQALDDLSQLQQQLSPLNLYFDLAESRGYSYHTGLVFAAYIDGHGQAIAKGGRYDQLSKAFGRDRPATGFSTNLRSLVNLLSLDATANLAIFAPANTDVELLKCIKRLRQQGETVIQALPQQAGDARSMGCQRQLQQTANGWQVVNVL